MDVKTAFANRGFPIQINWSLGRKTPSNIPKFCEKTIYSPWATLVELENNDQIDFNLFVET